MCYSSAGKVCVAIMIIALMLIGFTFFVGGVFPVRQHVKENYKDFTIQTASTAQLHFIGSGFLGLLVCAVSMCGICLVLWWTESRCLFYWLALIVVAAIIVDIILIVQVEKVKKKFNGFLSSKLPLYGVVPSATRQIDFFQRKFHCCGVHGPEDYNALGKGIPDSCCSLPVVDDTTYTPPKKSYLFGDTPSAHRRVTKLDYLIEEVESPNHTQESIPEPFRSEPMYDDLIQGQGNGDFNVSTRIGFELPPKNLTGIGPPDTGGVGSGSPGHLVGCEGCLDHILDKYKPYFIMFYVMITAKILLQIAVGVSPCWLLIEDKIEDLDEIPSDEVQVPRWTR